MRRVLMVNYYFPPLGGIGSLRALKFATYLPEFGWEPTVLAPRDGAYYRDPSLAFPEERVVRTRSLELSRLGKRALAAGGTDTEPALVGPFLGRAREMVRRWIYRPDAQVGWYPFAVFAGRRTLRARRFDAIVSSSFPITAHLVARRLHRSAGLPWVAEFRDPWTDLLDTRDPRRRRDKPLERALVAEADVVVVPSPDSIPIGRTSPRCGPRSRRFVDRQAWRACACGSSASWALRSEGRSRPTVLGVSSR